MRKISNKTNAKCLIIAAAVIVSVLCLIPYIAAARYSIFHFDDFHAYNNTVHSNGSSYLIKSFQSAHRYYTTWQGTYFCNWVSCFLNPFRWGFEHAFTACRLFLVLLVAGTAAAAFWTCIEADKSLKTGGLCVLLCSCVMIPFLIYGDYYQVYGWFVGAAAYLMPTFFLFLSFALLFWAQRTGRDHCTTYGTTCGRKATVICVLSCISLFLTAGGVLCIGALGACFMLLLVSVDFLGNKRFNKFFLAAFLAIVVGDLLNTLAPGNYVKYGMSQGTSLLSNLPGVIFASLRAVFQGNVYLFGNTVFVAFLFAAVCIGWSANIKLSKIQTAAALVILAFTPAVTIFPVMLGYNGGGIEALVNRNEFVLYMAIILCDELFAATAANAVRTAEIIKKPIVVMAACLTLALTALNAGSLANAVPVKITENLRNGKIQSFAAGWHNIFAYMNDSPGEDIILIEMPVPCVGVMDLEFPSNPESAEVRAVAECFNNAHIYTGYYISQHPEVLK